MRHKIKLCRHNREQCPESIGCEIERVEQDVVNADRLIIILHVKQTRQKMRRLGRRQDKEGIKGSDGNGGYGTNDVQEMNEQVPDKRQQVRTSGDATVKLLNHRPDELQCPLSQLGFYLYLFMYLIASLVCIPTSECCSSKLSCS
ncbi:hypothetical protein BDFB_004171 [Asbolus verrucosus]|uniref:Uncharacterized protein n=1 Tax=Asbolus verrucosus TaxID=1661398 RepID=A0A482VAN0_ASBVE|nr:hypothetical protein BDFB_004171 [Asbolus verrucosus]